MEEGRRYARLGLFVLVSVSVLVLALLLLGGRKWLQPTFTFETYFNQSIAGLEVGAPVRFRGVPLGHVSEILTSAATYERDVPVERRREYIVVRVEVNLSAREATQMRKDAATLIEKGLRAQTQLAGLTGQQYLALDFFDPQKNPPLDFPWVPKYTYVPSAPSMTGQIISRAQTFLANLNEADIKALGRNLNALVAELDTKLGEVPVAELSAEAQDVLVNANGALGQINRSLSAAPLEHTLRKLDSTSTQLSALLGDPALKQTLDNIAVITGRLRRVTDEGELDRTVSGLDEAAERIDALLGDNQYDIRAMVEDLRVTSGNLRQLSETLKRNPGVLLGGPPQRVRLPGDSR